MVRSIQISYICLWLCININPDSQFFGIFDDYNILVANTQISITLQVIVLATKFVK